MTDQAERTQASPAATDEGDSAPLGSAPRRVRPRWLTTRPMTVDVVGLGLVLVAAAFLWGRAASMTFWLDEGISVGVAAHPLRSIPHLLLQDGSPPFYYLVLRVWTSLFGSSDTVVHLLSLLFALATLPAALWAGWSLFDRRTGWMCVFVVVINPFVAYYATETRMYSLAILLGLLSTATFLHVYVFGRRRYLPLFALSQVLLIYTHNWGLLLGLGAAVALVPLLVLSDDRRHLLVDAALGFGAVAVLYAPWLPSLAYQVGQHLQPWGRKADLVWVRDDVAQMVGGNEALIALGLGAGIGLVAMLQGRGWTRQALAVTALAVIPVVALAAGWRESVWAYRYLAIIVGPFVLVAGLGLARGGRVAVAALAMAAFLTPPIALRGPQYQKSNIEAVAAEVSPQLRRGDLVVLPDFQMVPLVAHYLRPGLRYASASGLVVDKDIVDWRHSMDRLVNDDPATTVSPLIDSLPEGGHVLVLCPPPESESDSTGLAQARSAEKQESSAPSADGEKAKTKTMPLPEDVAFHPLILLRCQQTNDLLSTRPGLDMQEALKAPGGVRYTAVDGLLFTKTS